MAATTPRPAICFGPFELDLTSGELRKSGVAIRLQPHPAKVLVLLAGRAGQLVTRDDIKAELWGQETFVDFEQGLNFCIRQIRQALADNADSPLYIQTLPRRGYRFIAPVSAVPAEPVGDLRAQKAEHSELANRPRTAARRRLVMAGVVLVPLLIVLLVGRKWLAARENAPTGKIVLAVLPFENMSGDPKQDYFSEGLTDEVITDLGQLQPGRLGVIARTSVMQYGHTEKTIREIGHELGADYILEGGVSRGTDELRVNAQLIQVRDQTHLWTESYEFALGDVLKLQDQVAARIVSEIHLQLTPEEHAKLESHPWLNPDAHEAYLKGRFFWNRRTEANYLEAIRYFREAIAKDPNYAQAYAGLADALALLGSLPDPEIPRVEAMPEARANAERALQLDESLAEAHTSLAFVKMHYDWDWSGAETEYERAIQLNPSYATAREWHAYLLMAMGNKNAAVAEMEEARRLDPLSLIINTDLGEMLIYTRNYDQAIDQLQGALKMDPDFTLARVELGLTYMWKGSFREAMSELTQASQLPEGKIWALPSLGIALARSGKTEEARKIQREIEKNHQPRHLRPYILAVLDSQLGETDKALSILTDCLRRREGNLILLKVAPEWDSLRSDPRFIRLVQQVGLP